MAPPRRTTEEVTAEKRARLDELAARYAELTDTEKSEHDALSIEVAEREDKAQRA